MNGRMFLIIGAAVALSNVIACGTPSVKHVDTKESIRIEAHQDPKPIQFRKVVVKLDRGHHIGQVAGGWACVKHGDLTWRSGRVSWADSDLNEIFREELEKYGYEVVGDPDALFEDPSAWRAELLVAGLVTDLKANLCYPNLAFGSKSAKGNGYIKVEWQVYSRLDRSVVYESVTEGDYVAESSSLSAEDDVIFNAFSEAVHNLLADRRFYELVTATYDVDETPGSQFDPITLACSFDSEGDIRSAMPHVRSGTVTVYAGDGHGSGFVVDPSGYVITNAHVVGGAKFVTVRFTTGREILGEVVRTHKRRDVALVKLEEGNLPALAIRLRDVGIGEEVYAVGSPLDDDYSTTVSRGIVSAYRDIDGLKYIQSDVNVQPGSSGGPLLDDSGNVIGIATMGRRGMMGEMTGLNFFVPIGDACQWLAVHLDGSEPEPLTMRGR